MTTYDVIIYSLETNRVKRIYAKDRLLRGSFSAEAALESAELHTNTRDDACAIVGHEEYAVGDFYQGDE